MSTQEVCRLCLSEENLMCVFDKRLEKTDHMKEVILITTGVEIHSKDVISQKICTKCGQDAVKMFQFRQQSLKNDRYLKAQCRELLKHTDLKIPNTDVTIKTERIEKEEIKQEPPRKPPYKVHPTMKALSRRYPQMQFPSICLLSNVDPCVSMEMDTVENYFKNRNLNMRRYAQEALRASTEVIPKKTSTLTQTLVKTPENSQSSSIVISKMVDNAKVVDKINPINIKLNPSGYAIVKPSTGSITHGEVKNGCESTSSCKKLITGCPESQTGISESKKRKLPEDFLSEPETKKILSTNPSLVTPVHPSVEKISPPVIMCNNSCLVKEALNNMPDVEVERVELNLNVRRHYKDAFINFPPLPGFEKIISTSKSSTIVKELIENISNDEGTSVLTEKPLSTKSVCLNSSASTTSTVTKTSPENPPVSLVIRPDVRMKNDNILDSLKRQTPDIESVKELLTKFRKLQSATDKATQTELPSTESIRLKTGIFAAEMINLKQALYSYQIPVNIRKGSTNAFYNYQPTPPRLNVLKFWNDLTPIDYKTESNSVSEVVIMDITETPSNSITNDGNSRNIRKSCDSLNIDEIPVQNIEIVPPERSNGFASTSDSSQRKSPTISTQTESFTSTLDCTAVQAEPLTFISARSSLLDATHSQSNRLEIFPAQATSSIGDIPIGRHSPNTFETDPSTRHVNNHSPQVYQLQAISSSPNTLSGRNSSGADQTTSQNNAYINSRSSRVSPVLNNSDVNAGRTSLNTQFQAMDCTTKTRQDLTNNVIDYVFNKGIKSIDTNTLHFRPPNSHQPRPSISKTSRPSKRKTIQRDQNIRHVPATTTHSKTNGQSSYSNAPVQKNTINDNNLFLRSPPPYSYCSTPANQTTQSYISSYTNTSNVPHGAEIPQTSGYNNAFHKYVSQLKELRSFQAMGRTAGSYGPNVHMNNGAQRKTDHFTASNPLRNSFENHSFLQAPDPFSYKGTEPPTFPQYSIASNYFNASATLGNVNQNSNVGNMQSPIATCTDSSTLAACDTLAESVLPPDKSKQLSCGMIRVRNVSELT